ncbi:MAG: OsmC family protein [Desulfovibrio sp.]|jgi:putative redox protein|nr:OsmC family protein [Desulfovibrio sp.]
MQEDGTMSVQARHREGAVFELSAGPFAALSDNSAEYGGTDNGPRPSELLLWAVSSCLGQSIRYMAQRMRKNIEGLTLDVSGIKDPGNFRFREIRVRLRTTGDIQELRKVLRLAKKYCFVSNSLAVPVSYEVVGEEEERAYDNESG